MNLYPLISTLLFRMDPERAHGFSLWALDQLHRTGLLRLFVSRVRSEPVEVMGLRFENPVGLAAGLDKNGDHINSLAACGFGFIEIGTVTPKPQPGNPRPRLFRLNRDRAIINRMGFNNKGIDHLVDRVRKSRPDCVLGINIGKNKSTPNERAVDDYVICFRKAYPVADYITINISSPNTPGLRELQGGAYLHNLLYQMKQEQAERNAVTGRYVPIAVKIAPDISVEEIRDIAGSLLETKIDAVIATNTTNDRPDSLSDEQRTETGGLSGAPLAERADRVLRELCRILDGQIPVIASGGVMDAEAARRKSSIGASLVQVYTGFIYRGPALIAGILDGMRD